MRASWGGPLRELVEYCLVLDFGGVEFDAEAGAGGEGDFAGLGSGGVFLEVEFVGLVEHEVLDEGAGEGGLAGDDVEGGAEAVAVGDDADAVGGGEGADFEQFGGAAAPFGVGLDDFDGVGLEEAVDFPAAVEVFAGGDGDGGGARELGEVFELVGDEGFLDPVGAGGFGGFGPVDGVLEVPAVVGVEHDFGVVAEGFAEGFDEFEVFLQAVGGVAGAVGEEPFLVSEAFGFELGGAAGGGFGLDGVAEATGVGFDVGAGWPAEEAEDGGVEEFAAEIPEGVIDGGKGHHVMTGAGVAVAAIELVPEGFAGEGVFADEEGAELGEYDADGFGVERAIEAFDGGIGFDAEVEVFDGAGGFLGVGVVVVGLGAVFGVDVEGLDLVLAIEAGEGVAFAFEAEDFEVGNARA